MSKLRTRYYALTQTAYDWLQEHNPELLDNIFSRVLVFGRMKPTGKVSVVHYWQRSKQKVVAMAGDGGNDCGALHAAHVGL